MSNPNPLRIFVAMPGTDMGPQATYKNPESVKQNLLKPVVDKLKVKLGREVILAIEKDKRQVGVIHESMFSEARDADVYIADLTGANPNVYLELGVRWAVCDRITVPISQSVEDLKFNVSPNRVIIYHPDILIQAIDDIVEAIEQGLKNNKCDSPVRLHSEFVTVPKSKLDSLEAEIERLKEARGEDLIRAARATENLSERILLLKHALDANPASVEAMLELGKACRDSSQYDEAVKTLQAAQRLDSTNAIVHRELGVTYSKQKKPALAVESLREAVRLAPQDAEAWSNLGGALRRLGMAKAPDSYDQKALEEARDSYNEAHKINKFDLYSGLNVARLNLLLSKWDSKLLDQAKEGFRKQVYLCRHTVEEDPRDYWRLFDLADALLFSGQYEDAQDFFNTAIALVPIEERKDKLLSVLGPLRDYLTADVLNGTLRVQVEETVNKLEAAREAT
jgi:tetratricopeptide (TPR) repeat protein